VHRRLVRILAALAEFEALANPAAPLRAEVRIHENRVQFQSEDILCPRCVGIFTRTTRSCDESESYERDD